MGRENQFNDGDSGHPAASKSALSINCPLNNAERSSAVKSRERSLEAGAAAQAAKSTDRTQPVAAIAVVLSQALQSTQSSEAPPQHLPFWSTQSRKIRHRVAKQHALLPQLRQARQKREGMFERLCCRFRTPLSIRSGRS
ncbi:hypothetical protein CV014_27985 [Nostoc sp. CMAA1605]|nr:hypothetical protein [Nostoc sp. CMAA1605]